jgi:hypothetical protein
MHNETGEPVETGDYWAQFVREKALAKGVPVHVTDMRRSENVRSEDHLHIVNNHELYSFLDISQNNATRGLGRDHYESILFMRERVASQPASHQQYQKLRCCPSWRRRICCPHGQDCFCRMCFGPFSPSSSY